MGYRQLTQTQRYQIHARYDLGISQRLISRELGLHSSTISRELRRNVTADGAYDPEQAQIPSDRRRRAAWKWTKRLTSMITPVAWDLAQANPKQIRQRFSVTLERTCLELKGIPCIEMNDPGEARQRIMTSRSFGRMTDSREEIHQAIRQFAQRSAEKLRRQDSLAQAVYVFLKTNRHRPDLPQYSPSAVVELPCPTDDSRDILLAASQAFAAIYRPRYRFMKAGVMLVDLVDANRAQLSLLDTPESQAQRERSDRLMATLDALNHRMGRGTVTFGRASPKAAWQLRCANRTPRWTTRWDELPQLR